MGIEFLSCPWTRTAPRSESAWTLATPPRVWRCTPIARVTRPLTQFTGVPFAVLAAALTALHLTAWRTAFGFSERWENGQPSGSWRLRNATPPNTFLDSVASLTRFELAGDELVARDLLDIVEIPQNVS